MMSRTNIFSTGANNENADVGDGDRIKTIIANSGDVESILQEVMSLVATKASASASTSLTASSSSSSALKAKLDEEAIQSINAIQSSFQNILANLQDSTKLTAKEKGILNAEINLIMEEVKGSTMNVVGFAESKGRLDTSVPQTAVYSPQCAPYCVVYGPGPVGQELMNTLKGLGKAADVRFLDGESLAVMQEAEINYAIRRAKAVIIAADEAPKKKPNGGGGWFGLGGVDSTETSACVVNDKGLKRLLNAAMKEKQKASMSSSSAFNVKVVCLAKAMKAPKGIGSFLAGEASDVDSEVILQATQRGLGYSIIKVGNIIDDNAPFPSGQKVRSLSASLPKLTEKEAAVSTTVIPDSPIVFTRSRVENAESTRVSTAVGALLRSVGHPCANSSISVLSTPVSNSDRLPTDKEWDDEFLKIEGPELHRIPLRFASVGQTAIKLGRIAVDLERSGSLITPIQVERFSNGVRILFRPKQSSYTSSKEDKAMEQDVNEQAGRGMGGKGTSSLSKADEAIISKRPGGYLSPEQEAAAAERASQVTSVPPPKSSVTDQSNQKKVKPEGGLEVIVDTSPYNRVRIRRCNMGPDTIVKEESESIVIKALLRGIEVLDNDYKILLLNGLKGA